MKISLVGAGKTGSSLLELIPQSDLHAVFTSRNKPSLAQLKGSDVIICFVPAEPFTELVPLFLASGLPVVTGTTNFEFSSHLKEKVRATNTTWIHAQNFSKQMNFCFYIAKLMQNIFPDCVDQEIVIEDVHHIHKKDSPSGTALKLAACFTKKPKIYAKRQGDVCGKHTLKLKTRQESLTFCHEAHDRSMFAKGAIEAAKLAVSGSLTPGLKTYEEIMAQSFQTVAQNLSLTTTA